MRPCSLGQPIPSHTLTYLFEDPLRQVRAIQQLDRAVCNIRDEVGHLVCGRTGLYSNQFQIFDDARDEERACADHQRRGRRTPKRTPKL